MWSQCILKPANCLGERPDTVAPDHAQGLVLVGVLQCPDDNVGFHAANLVIWTAIGGVLLFLAAYVAIRRAGDAEPAEDAVVVAVVPAVPASRPKPPSPDRYAAFAAHPRAR